MIGLPLAALRGAFLAGGTGQPAAPAGTVLPALSGTPRIGQILTVSTGSWNGTAPIGFGFAWERDGMPIPGATGPAYLLVAADDLAAIRCVVTATNVAGSAQAASGPVDVTWPVPANLVAPAVSGGVAPGAVLACTTGSWADQASLAFAFQWFRGPNPIAGATGASYMTVTADIGSAISCRVTATNSGGSTAAASGNAVTVQAAAIPVDSGALRFPAAARLSTTAAPPAWLTCPNFAPSANRIFSPAAPGAFLMLVEVPWEAAADTLNTGVFGNRGAGSQNQTMGIWVSRGATDQGARTVSFFVRDGAGVVLSAGLAVAATQRRLLLAMRMVAGQMQFELYHEGSRIGLATPAMGTFAATQLRSTPLLGTMGEGSGVPYAAGGWTGFYGGAVAFLGYADATPSQADCEALSLGADPVATVGGTNWRFFRRTTGTDAASLASAAPGDTFGPMTVTNPRALAFLPGSDLVPAAAGGARFGADHVIDGRVFSRRAGQAQGTITLSGTAAGLAGGVEARLFDADGTIRLDWTPLAGASLDGGTWSGTVSAPPTRGWGHIDVRPSGNSALLRRIRARTGVGLVIGVMGQSQMYRCFNPQYVAAATPVPAGAGALSVLDVQNRSATQQALISTVVTAENRHSDGVAAVAAMLPSWTAEPVALINMSNPGQGVAELLNDASTAWNWSELVASVAQAGAPAALAINWLTNFAGDVNQPGGGIVGNHVRPLIEGVRDPAATTSFPIDHFIRDGNPFPADMRIALSPPTRTGSASAGPFDSSDTESAPNNHGTGRGQWLDYALANPGLIAATGPATDDVRIEPGGGPHQDGTVDEGHPRTLRRVVLAALRALGVETRTDPAIGGAAISPDRTQITVTVTCPNGGTLQTAWALKGVAVPPGQTAVQGFEVQNGGAGAWSRSGFDAQILDPVAGTVRLVRTAGSWSPGTRLRYLANGPLSYGTALEAESLIHGCLYESGPDEGGLGLPVTGLWTSPPL
jgi:hypothetical protein